MPYLYLITGLSGVGKTTLGKELAKHLHAQFVDVDSFYRSVKPMVHLSNGDITQNWDCYDAIDWERLNFQLHQALQRHDVVLVGFVVRPEWIANDAATGGVYRHISLNYSTNDDHANVVNACIAARRQSKGFSGEKARRDELMVREVVIPYFLNNQRESDISVVVFDKDGKRRPIAELLDEVVVALDD